VSVKRNKESARRVEDVFSLHAEVRAEGITLKMRQKIDNVVRPVRRYAVRPR